MAETAVNPAMAYEGWAPPCSGLPLDSPDSQTRPPAAPATRSLAFQSFHSAFSPNGVTEHWISEGLMVRSTS